MDSHQGPKKTPAHDSRVWTPVEIEDPALKEIEIKLAEQERVFRAALEGIAAARGASVDVGEELRALEELCTSTGKAPAPRIGMFAIRC